MTESLSTEAALRDNLIRRVNVGDTLTRSAARTPDKEAVVDGARRFTYAALEAWTNRIAHGLLAKGYKRGDSLALMSGNSAEFLVTYYACAKLGVVCVPINLGWKEQETAYVLQHSGARGVVVETQLVAAGLAAARMAPGVRDIVVAPGLNTEWKPELTDRHYETFEDLGRAGPETAPEVFVGERDPISYLYTSGTTAAPKGVVSSHLAVFLETSTVTLDMALQRRDRILCLMPFFHTAQLNCFCTPTIAIGATIVVRRGFDALAVLDLIDREQLTVLFMLPMMYRGLTEVPKVEERDFSNLRLAIYAMAPMPDSQLRQCMALLRCDFCLLFGQTEMNPISTIFLPEHQLSHPGAVGFAGVNTQVAIMDEAGTLLPRGAQGEIVYRSGQIMEGYLRDPAETARAFRHGWFHSGDVGHFGEDGMLWFDDRLKDVIKSGGENVASIEVEKLVYEVAPSVHQAVVIGLPHPRWGEAITVVAVPRPGSTLVEAEVIAKLKERLSGFKVPKAVIVMEQLPMTSTGKIQKNVLRQQLIGHYAKAT